MPNREYYIEIENNTVATFETKTSTANGVEFGSTEVKLKSHSILSLIASFKIETVLVAHLLLWINMFFADIL